MTETKQKPDTRPRATSFFQNRGLSSLGSVLRWLIVLGWVIAVGSQALAPLKSAADFSRVVIGPLPTRALELVLAAGLMLLAAIIGLNLRRPSALRPLLLLGMLVAVTSIAYGMQTLLASLCALYVLLVAGAVGMMVLHLSGASEESPLEQLVLSLILGLGILAILGLGVGMVGGLHRPLVFGGSATLAAGCAFFARRSLAAWSKKVKTAVSSSSSISWFGIGCLAVLSVFFLFNLLNALAPEVGFDALKSHLALAKIYSEQHRVSGLWYSLGSYWPLGGDLLFTLGYQLGGETTAKLIHFIAGLLAAGTAYLLGTRLHSSEAGMAAATIFYATPIVSWETGTAYADLFMAMYAGAAMLLLLKWRDKADWASAVWLGAILGFAFGIKPTAAFLALGVGLAMLYSVIRGSANDRARGLLMLFGVTLVTALVGGIWYLRAYWLTGNPVFPFLNHIFRSLLWLPVNEQFNFGLFGIGHTVPALAKVFWLLTFKTSLFGEVFDGAAGLAFLLLLPLFFLFVRTTERVILLLIVAGIPALEWLFGVQYLRYIITIFPLLAVICGWAMIAIWKNLAAKNRWTAAFVPTVFLVMVAAHLAFTIRERWYLATAAPWDILSGHITKEKYRERITAPANVFDYVNAHLPAGEATLFAVGESFQYLSEAVLLTPGFTMEGERILRSTSEDELVQRLKENGINYVLINRNIITGVVAKKYPELLPFQDGFYEKHARLIYSYNNVYLYRVVHSGTPCQEEAWRESLNNPGLEEGGDATFTAWEMVGKPAGIDRPETIAGERSVRVDAANWLQQRVAIQEGKLYSFSATVKSATGSQVPINLQVEWLGEGGRRLDQTISTQEAELAAGRHSLSVTAPPGAKTAVVAVTVYSGSVIYDEATFRLRTGGEDCL